jgi:Tfp pilus assembly protein PilO
VSCKRILAAIGLLLAGMAWPLAVDRVAVRGRLEQRADAAEDALGRARTTRAEIAVALGARARFAAEVQQLERELTTLRRQWPARADRDAALTELRAAAGALGLEVLASRQEAPRNGRAWREVPLEVTLAGGSGAVLELVERMEGRAARTAVSRLHLSATRRPGVARAELELVLLEPPSDTAPPGAR